MTTEFNRAGMIKTILKLSFNEAAALEGHDGVCNCGTCTEAVRAAIELYDNLRKNGKCGHWASQVIAGMRHLAVLDTMLHFGVDPVDIGEKPEDEHTQEDVMLAGDSANHMEDMMYKIIATTVGVSDVLRKENLAAAVAVRRRSRS